MALKLGFDVIDIFSRLDTQCVFFAVGLSYKYLHPAQIQHGTMFDSVFVESCSITEFFTTEGKPLFFLRNFLLLLNLIFDIVDCVIGINSELNLLSIRAVHFNHHRFKIQNRLMLDVAVLETFAIIF